MATATVSYSQLSPNVKAVHTGIVCVGGAASTSTTWSPSSIHKICQVPHGATIVDFWGKIATGGAGQSLQLGTSQTRSGIMAVMTICMTFSFSASISLDTLTLVIEGPNDQKSYRAPGGTRGGVENLMPVRISLSDDAQPQSIWVLGTLGAGVSASAFHTFMMFYTMDGLAGRTTIR